MNECVFCTDVGIQAREVLRTEFVRAFPTNIPIVPGHMIVCPTRCVTAMAELSNEERGALFSAVEGIKEALKKTFGAQGFNHAWNEGVLAGQSVQHLHIHVIPRKEGDEGITEYEPRKFLYRPGERRESPEKELLAVSKLVRDALGT